MAHDNMCVCVFWGGGANFCALILGNTLIFSHKVVLYHSRTDFGLDEI